MSTSHHPDVAATGRFYGAEPNGLPALLLGLLLVLVIPGAT